MIASAVCPAARIINLDLARPRLVRDRRAAAIENHHDVNPAPILVIAQLLDQCLAREGGAPFVQRPQFGPGENNAMAIDQEILRSHLSRYDGGHVPGNPEAAMFQRL